jgi:hypothetical protein
MSGMEPSALRRRAAMIVLASALVASAPGCFALGSEPVPKALREYLEALRDGDYASAYRRTQLAELSDAFGLGAALSLDHFRAFHRANPLRRYEVDTVTRLDRRSVERADVPGSAFFEVDVDLIGVRGKRREVFTVDGEVLGTVNVEPDRVFIRSQKKIVSLVIDGVKTPVRERVVLEAIRAYPVLLLSGRHVIGAGVNAVTVETNPLSVVGARAHVSTDLVELLVLERL